MANEKHLAKLKEGVEVWNKWRRENYTIRPDLSGADLREVNLEEADLGNVDFREADLGKANLHRAYLDGAELNGANLSGANLYKSTLQQANLNGANLNGVNLSQVNLREANLYKASLQKANLRKSYLVRTILTGADLSRSDLSGANLYRANIEDTRFIDVDLSQTKDLGMCYHNGPSTIDHRTLERSGEKIPLSFLRGCGLPDWIIEGTKANSHSAIRSCYIGYAEWDQNFAVQLYTDLQNNGVRCWLAPEAQKIGDKIQNRREDAIWLHDKLILIFSRFSIESKWIEREITNALNKEKETESDILFPVRLDDQIFDLALDWAKPLLDAEKSTAKHIGDFTNGKDHDNYQKALDRLMEDLKAKK